MRSAGFAAAARRPADAAAARPHPHRPAARPEPAPAVRLQRCACGGGCPRCRGAGAGLSVSRPGDADEVAAERMAGAALGPAPVLRRAADGPAGVEAALPPALDGLRGGGRPLPADVRAELEPRFGADFGAVRVHADAPAAALAERHGAQAFTVGRDIAFGAGRYAPRTPGGRALLAHELAHVAQQRGAVDATRLQAKVVDDDEHLPCRTTPEHAGRTTASYMTGLENDAAAKADAAAAALRASPLGERARELVWKRFKIDYNDPRTRCRFVPTIADRLEQIARAIRTDEYKYVCSLSGQPSSLCAGGANAVTWFFAPNEVHLCENFWNIPDQHGRIILHEWAHAQFVTRGLRDDTEVGFDSAECYASFAYELAGVTGVFAEHECPQETRPLPPRNETRIAEECPTNVFSGTGIMGGYLTGLPGGLHYGTIGFGWDMRLPLTRMHDWELSVGPRITAAIPTQGGERPPLAYLLGVRTALEFRYRPWRFGYNVGGYVEGGAALAPSTSTVPGENGAYRFNPYAIGGVTGTLNVPLGREQALQIFGQVGGGVGLNTSDSTAFGLFQAGLGLGFEFH